MALARFDTPASLRDVPAGRSDFYDAWHRTVGDLITDRAPMSGRGRAVDPARVHLTVRNRRTVTWTGFSRPLLMEHRDDRGAAFAAGEDRKVQIEYLEWHVTRKAGTITRVDFVSETPEYWKALAAYDRRLVLRLYRRLVGPQVQPADLFPGGGAYDPENRWNTTDGIVHFIMPINSMKDLLGVSQEAPGDPAVRDGFDALPYFRPTGADARISFDNWAMTRTGRSVAPVAAPGLYIADRDDTGFTRPDGSPVGDYWTVQRGRPGAVLRLRYEVPAAEGFAVGDIRIGGRRITTGGQIAEHIVMSAHCVAGAAR
jgi:hypothetical protein